MFPGRELNQSDTGLGTLGRIDHANFAAGTLVPMHPHINDEILTYLRSGKVKHTDSEGFSEYIEPTRLMLMKAGSSFFHEEKILDNSDPLTALQIFIRPKEKDLKPEVIFYEIDSKYSENKWRLIASPTTTTPPQFSSKTWIYDIKIDNNKILGLPELPLPNPTCLLYAFNGHIKVNNEIELSDGDSMIVKNEEVTFLAIGSAEFVLFVTDERSSFYDGGVYSGNQL